MLGVEGKWRLKVDLISPSGVSIEDFITPDTFFKAIFEFKQFLLPAFQLEFKTQDENIFKALREGSKLRVFLGATSHFDFSIDTYVFKKIIRPTTGFFHIVVTSLAYPEFVTDYKIESFSNKTSLDVISEVASRFVEVDNSLCSTPSDKMTWIRYQTPRTFIVRVWNHSYIPESVMLLGLGDKLYIKDLKTLAIQEPRWKVGDTTVEGIDILVNSDLHITSNSNSSVLLEKNLKEVDYFDLSESDYSPTTKAFLSFSRDRIVNDRPEGIFYGADNVHKNYWKAKSWNTVMLTPSVKASVQVKDNYIPFKMLDLCYLKLTKENKSEYENVSGLYYINRISYSIGNNTFNTFLDLYKEEL